MSLVVTDYARLSAESQRDSPKVTLGRELTFGGKTYCRRTFSWLKVSIWRNSIVGHLTSFALKSTIHEFDDIRAIAGR